MITLNHKFTHSEFDAKGRAPVQNHIAAQIVPSSQPYGTAWCLVNVDDRTLPARITKGHISSFVSVPKIRFESKCQRPCSAESRRVAVASPLELLVRNHL